MSDVDNEVGPQGDPTIPARISALIQAGSYLQGGIQALKLAQEVYLRIERDDTELAEILTDIESEKADLQSEVDDLKAEFDAAMALPEEVEEAPDPAA
jgi:hypothetical protein